VTEQAGEDCERPDGSHCEETGGPSAPQHGADSAKFARCSSCAYGNNVNGSAGTLLCGKHDMVINAEADEIPDDCADYEPLPATGAAGESPAGSP